MTGWIVETLFATTLLMLLVLAIRTPVAHAFGPRIAYLLWLLPALRMVLPPLPEGVGAPPMAAAMPAIADFSFADIAVAATPVGPAAPSIDWALVLLAIWLGGAASHFVWHLLSYRRFTDAILRNAVQLPQLDRDGIEVCASKAVRSPFAAGIFLKTIVLPYDYRNRYNAEELRLALSHETVHHLRCDMSANLLALVTLSLHWFNPVAWRAHRAFRIDQELACDAIVLANASSAERHAYGSALIKSTCDRLPVAACALGAGDLKRRLRMMGMKQRSKGQLRAGAALATVLVGGGLALTASGGLAAETTKEAAEQVQTVVVDKVAAVAPEPVRTALAPLVPAAPPAPVVAPAPPVPVAAISPHPAVPAAPVADELRIEIDEAIQDAMEASADAREAAMEAAVEARAEAMAAAHEVAAKSWPRVHASIAPEKLRAMRTYAAADAPRVIRTRCATSKEPVISKQEAGPGGKQRELLIVCTNFQPISHREIIGMQIEALEDARDSIADIDSNSMSGDARRQALASIDRRIAELRKQR